MGPRSSSAPKRAGWREKASWFANSTGWRSIALRAVCRSTNYLAWPVRSMQSRTGRLPLKPGWAPGAQVRLHEAVDALDSAGLIEAAEDVDIIVADRLTAGPGEIFPALPNLCAFVRCAVDIRNIDVGAASAAGVLVTRAGPGFVQSVAELALGFMVDLSRGVSRATANYHSERAPEIIMGRQLAGSRLGIIGYGSIGRYLAQIAKGLGMEG